MRLAASSMPNSLPPEPAPAQPFATVKDMGAKSMPKQARAKERPARAKREVPLALRAGLLLKPLLLKPRSSGPHRCHRLLRWGQRALAQGNGRARCRSQAPACDRPIAAPLAAHLLVRCALKP